MNRERRKKIKEIANKLRDCSASLSSVKDEEDEARENIPENLQDGEAYCTSEEYSDKIEDAISDLDAVVENLEDI